jgi:hypothetical protein
MTTAAPPPAPGTTPGRNDPCGCGSGLRYKSCHGRIATPARLVDFVVAGTQKGGTSALSRYLDEHIEVCMAKVKEVHFFNKDRYFASDPPDYTAYHAYFAPGPLHKVLGEATPGYMHWNAAPQRLARYNPAMKLVMLLRDPAQRAYSHWNMQFRQRNDPLPFEEALLREEERAAAAAPSQLAKWAYVSRGLYGRQLRNVWAHIPREQTLVLRSEDLHEHAPETLARIAAFLGIAPFPRTDPRNVFALPYDEPISDAARAFLRRAFADDIDDLERMLGWDLGAWR